MLTITNEADYAWALARIEALWDCEPGTPEGDEFDALGTLVDEYESIHFPIDKPNAVEAWKFRLSQEE
jgi:HTH-type transcriptional regulator/antitoxin HigA